MPCVFVTARCPSQNKKSTILHAALINGIASKQTLYRYSDIKLLTGTLICII